MKTKICCKCGKRRQVRFFYTKRQSYDGLHSRCVDCFELWRKKRIKEYILNRKKITRKKCAKCKKIKSAKCFAVDNGTVHGLAHYCKQCWSEYRKTSKYKEHRIRNENIRRENKINAGKKYSTKELQILRREVFKGKYCLCCGATIDITVDHIKPLSKGGNNSILNIQYLCRSCNSIKGTKKKDYRTPYQRRKARKLFS